MRYLVCAVLSLSGSFICCRRASAGSERLAALYGIAPVEATSRFSCVSRGALWLLGLFLVVAAFNPALQIAAFVAGF